MSAAVPKPAAPNQASPRGSVKPQALPQVDYWLLVPALALLAFGFVMVSSASLPAGDRIAGNPLHFPLRHAIAIGLGLAAALLVTQVPMAQWERSGTWLYFIGLLLLLLVLVPGLGRTVNGATRWIPIGPFSLQSSEMMKLFMVIYSSGYLVRRQAQMASFWGFARPMILLVVACFLIMLQPDFGTTAVLLATALGLLFMGGVAAWQFTLLLGLAASALAGLVILSPYRLQRITTFIDPWADPYDSGFQLTQALIAFGRGEWAGVGLGNGIQKQFYLPEAHTDFLMAVIGEEFGFVGTLAVIVMFALITWRAFQIGGAAERLERRFCAYVAYGFGLWIGMQAFINIGVNMGLLPTKGLTLPLMSYGGNSIIVACVVIAMLLRIDWENRQTRPSQAWGKVLWGGV
jgi:cell division protein FtsW